MTADLWIDTQQPALDAIAGSGRYPTFAKVLGRLGETGYDLDLDELFDLRLQSLMDGFAVLVRTRSHPQ